MLDQLKRVMNRMTELLITTPNAFGLLAFLRHAANMYREGDDQMSRLSRSSPSETC